MPVASALRARAPPRRRARAAVGVGHQRVGERARGTPATPSRLVGEQPVEHARRRRARCPRRRSGSPACAMNAAVGPFSTAPPTIGETATTGRGRRAQRLGHPGHGEDRADRDDRVRRADHDRARAPAIASSTAARRLRRVDRRRTRRRRPGPRRARGSGTPAGRVQRAAGAARACAPARRTSAARARATPIARGQRGVRLRRRLAGGEAPPALQAPGEVAVAEVEPRVRRAELAQRVHDGERVAAQPPAALVDRGRRARSETRSGSGETAAP